ncbi:MAG: hypothetical protein DRO96_02535 [Candidatus Aenigmatarchaeota archaeon]|nr:MAG: hypothetical protein B6U68_02690 [Candidatus Aenigmarchaeota archaeon ex4484_14]RLI96671.1 MAG: hypothetical protein DRO96_02535 [Candidatus Aenigmarchaeota archaeon]
MDWLHLTLLTIMPGLELRAAIPYALFNGDGIAGILFVLLLNVLIFFPVWVGLLLLYRFAENWWIVKNVVNKIRKRGEPYVKKYGIPGIAIFVAIPLPGSGVYSGTLLAWLLGLEWRKSFVACAVGVIFAAIAVYLISTGALSALKILSFST